jgi:hypothetical protein
MEGSAKRTEQAHNSGTISTRLVKTDSALACAHGCPRCDGSAPEPSLPSRAGQGDSEGIDKLEKRMNEFGPMITRTIEERPFGVRRPRIPEPRSKADHSATPRTTQIAAPPSEQGGEEWRVVEPRKRRRTDKKKPEKTVASEVTKIGATKATSTRAAGAPRPSAATVATKKTLAQVPRTAALPRTPRTSEVTVTLNGGANMSYADVLATAREKIPLTEIGVESVETRKAMTGAIIIRVPGDRDKGKASRLAAGLTKVLDPTAVRVAAPTKTAGLRVVGIDISVN